VNEKASIEPTTQGLYEGNADEETEPVSYTHLDVYKRQAPGAVPQHGGSALVLPAPRNSLAQQGLRLADVKRCLRGKKMLIQSL